MLLEESAWPLRPRGGQGAAPPLHAADRAAFLSGNGGDWNALYCGPICEHLWDAPGQVLSACCLRSYLWAPLRRSGSSIECVLSGQHKLENARASSILNAPRAPSPVNPPPQDLAQDKYFRIAHHFLHSSSKNNIKTFIFGSKQCVI